MSDLNHTNYNKEISFIELLINLWNFKKVFFYILVPLIIFGFFLDTFISKKSKNIFRLQHPFKINLDVYPAESTLSSVVLYNLGSMNIQNINIRDQKISIDFYSSYFKPRLMSKKFLIEFAEMNNDKYNLVEYINKNKNGNHTQFIKTKSTIKYLFEILGFVFEDKEQKIDIKLLEIILIEQNIQIEDDINVSINKFIAKRNEYRNNKEFSTADFMRNQLEQVGIVIEDGNESGWRWKDS